MKTLKISCQGADTIDISEMVPFQGALKTLNKEEEAELRAEIETTGFAFPIHIWRLPDKSFFEDKKFMVGGHQRHLILAKLRAEGWEIPPIPIDYVDAETPELARRRVLQDVSQYGTVTTQGLLEFSALASLTIDCLEASFRLPDVDFDQLRLQANPVAEGERQADGSVFNRTYEQYTGSIIKQMVLFFKADEFPKVIQRANSKLAEMGVADYSELFVRLLDEHDRDQASSNQ